MTTLGSLRLEHKFRRVFSLSPYNYYELLKHNYLELKSKRFLKNYLRHNEVRKLQIGCGFNVLQGWLNTDLGYKKNEIGFLNAGKKFPFESNTFDYIYSEHIFEHLNFKQESNMLSECFRVLKPNGIIRLATPNLKFLVGLYENPEDEINKDYIEWSLNNFLPEIKAQLQSKEGLEVYVINNFFRAWDHQIIHDVKSLKEFFKLFGFKDIAECSTGESNFLELQNLEKHENIVGAKFNKLETLIIEARK